MPLDARQFRTICGRFATGVTIVTSRQGDELAGMTVNSFCSLSLEPMLVLFCADTRTHTHAVVDASGIFAVNVLSAQQQDLSDRFAGRHGVEGAARFAGVAHHVAETGAPILEGSIGYFDCRVVSRLPGGDHTIFVGAVAAAEARDGAPLLFLGGQYRRLAEHTEKHEHLFPAPFIH